MSWTPGFSVPTPNEGGGGDQDGTTKSDVGLGNVDNTSDASKPVSTAQQAALDDKANKDGGNLDGPDVTSWRAALNLDTFDGPVPPEGAWVRVGGPGIIEMNKGVSGTAFRDTTSTTTLSSTWHIASAIGGNSGASPTLVNLNGLLYLRRFWFPPCTFDRIAWRQIAQGPAGSTIHFPIYAPDSPTQPGMPGTLITAPSAAGDTGGTAIRGVDVAYEHPGGWGWIGHRVLESAAGMVFDGEVGGYMIPGIESGSGLPNGAIAMNGNNCVISTGVTGALASNPTVNTSSIVVGSLMVRIASVP